MGNFFEDNPEPEPLPPETYEEILLNRLQAEKGFTTTSRALIAQIEKDLSEWREGNAE